MRKKVDQESWGEVCILNGVISISPTKKVTFEQRLEERKRISHVAIGEEEEQVVQRPWGTSVLPRSQKAEETGVPGLACIWGRTEGADFVGHAEDFRFYSERDNEPL